jgi:two-component system sensor histidine kinase MprB
MTLRRRLTVTAAVAVAATVVAGSVVVYVVVRDSLLDEVDSSLAETASGATIRAARSPSRVAPADRGRAPRRRGIELDLPTPALGAPFGVGQVVDASGRVVPGSGENGRLPVSEAVREVAAGTRDDFAEDVRLADGSELRVLTVNTGPGQALQVARSLDETDAALDRLLIVLAVVCAAGIALAAVLGALVSRSAVAPVGRLTAAAEHVTRTRDLGRRIDAGGSDDELGRLATSFNAMLAELEAAIASQRQLVADASHELRTPLTSLQTNIEVLAARNGLGEEDRRRLLADLVSQLGELRTLVDNLVDLAREPDPAPAEPDETVRLDVLAAEAVERARRRARETRFELSLAPCAVTGSPQSLERALDNLLDNAVKWSPPGGVVDLSVTHAGVLCVRDRGPGIDAADAPHVFERFYRARAARAMPGSGLGLAIVRQVAEAHGGAVRATTAAGGGAMIEMSLPPAASSANS